jgi:hypothetical protein
VKDTLNVMIDKSTPEKEILSFISSVEDEKLIQELDERYAKLLIDEAKAKL